MKFFRESILILSIYFAGEIISKLLNLPVPGNIIGITTIIVLSATALTVEFICKKKSKLENNNDNEDKFNKKEA